MIPDEPEFMTPEELVVWLHFADPDDEKSMKSALRWVKDRLMPSHPERLPHFRGMRNRPVFSRADRAEIKARFSVPGADQEADAVQLAEVIELDPKTLARARKVQARAERATA